MIYNLMIFGRPDFIKGNRNQLSPIQAFLNVFSKSLKKKMLNAKIKDLERLSTFDSN